jgi:hypothetical protein
MKQFGLKRFVLMMSILLIGAGTGLAESGPFENFFHKLRRAFSEPEHKSTHRSSHKQTDEIKNSQSAEPNIHTATGGVSGPPSERNTRSATRVTGKQQNGLAYGKPVPGKTGLVTSPYSPDGGYIDVRGFAPGTPVKDPYSGKIFLAP